jgi:ribose 5-phosphate isomerase B
MNNLKNKIIAIASDHAGFDKKQVILKYFKEKGIDYKDFGCFSNEVLIILNLPMPLEKQLIKANLKLESLFAVADRELALQQTNIRMCVRLPAGCQKLQRLQSNTTTQIFVPFPGRYTTDEEAIAIAEAYLNAEFEGGRHARRVAKIPLK